MELNSEGFRRRNLVYDDNADARLTSGFVVAGALTFIILSVVLFTDVPPIGPNEGELAPNLIGEVHMPNSPWEEFELYDEIDHSWDNESSPDSKWFLIQWMDTDCSHCWEEAEKMSALESAFGQQVTFISIAVELNIQNHDADRDEIVAFQEKGALSTCRGGDTDCSTRGGEVHNWAYFDDLGGSTMDPWGIQGTPFVVILKPNGIVAWNNAQHQGEDLGQALYELLPQPEAA